MSGQLSRRDSRTIHFETLEGRRLLSAASLAVAQPTGPIVAQGETIEVQSGQVFNGELGVISGLPRKGLQANINWGDGTEVSRGSFFTDLAGNLHIEGAHLYTQGGTFPIIIRLRRGNHHVLVAAFQSVADVTPSSVTLELNPGQPFSGVVGSFPTPAQGIDANTQALIDWGDGTRTLGTIQPDPLGGQDVIGSHTYDRPGLFRVTTFVSRVSDLGAVTPLTTISSEADVGGLIPRRGANHRGR